MATLRPTILQIIPALDTGGAELSTAEIAEAIVTAGGRALVATSGGRLASRIHSSGAEIITLPVDTKNPLRMFANARAIALLVRSEGVDLIHARSRAPAWSALWAARATKRPFVTTYHGAYAERDPLKRAYNSVMAKGDIVIANSGFTAGLIRSRYGTDEARLCIIHRGVDSAIYDPSAIDPARRDALRKSLGLLPGQSMILHAARLTSWKGQSVLIDALAKLAKMPDAPTSWVAILAGDDQGRAGYAAGLVRQIESSGLTAQIKLAGHVADMPAAFSLASVAVIASTEPEAFGRTAIEAQMMGCPVIATGIGAPPETVLAEPAVAATEKTGWLVSPSDSTDLANALCRALALPSDARAALSHRARSHSAANFSLAAMKRATLGVYDRLLDTRLKAAFDLATGAEKAHERLGYSPPLA